MASLVENSVSSADFKAAMETAERLSSLLCNYGDVADGPTGVNPSVQQPSLIAQLDDDLWKELYLLPTPPLSPECLDTNSGSSNHSPRADTEDMVVGSDGGMYGTSGVNVMEYDHMMDLLEEAERVLSDGHQSYQRELLLQDCMWSGGNCDPNLSTGGPGGSGSGCNSNISSSSCTDGLGDSPLCNSSDTHQAIGLDDNHCSPTDDAEPDCVEPAAVFPVLRTTSSDSGKSSKASSSSLRSSSSSICSSNRSRNSLSTSESEEEIDVVTVERSSDHLPTSSGNKSIFASTQSSSHGSNGSSGRQSKKQLAGSSRHNASANPTSSLRKKRHTKRLSRRASEDGMESDEEARRASHNVLERKRRNDLKNSFDILRGGIPELEENLRAPKVVILRKAVEYIHTLQTTDQKTKIDITREQARHKKLTERLTQLRNLCSI